MTLQKDTSFDQCIKCTVCSVYCPVAKANPEFPGPKQCGPDGERLRIKNPKFYDEALKYCTNCKRCETACPSGVRIGDIIAVARHENAQYLKSNTHTVANLVKQINLKIARDYILSHTDLVGTMASPFAPIINATTDWSLVKKVMHHTIGVHQKKSLPKYSTTRTFRHWYKNEKNNQSEFPSQIYYYHGCYVNYNAPSLGQDFIKVMNALNIGVQLIEKEKCCGVAMIVNNFHKDAQKNARHNIAQMENALTTLNVPIVSTSSTCSFTLRQEYPHILSIDNSKVVDQIFYVTRYLYQLFERGNRLKMKPLNLTVAYHTPCHLEKSGNRLFTVELLKQIPGITLHVLDSKCCGLAGTYGFKTENYETSMKIGADLFSKIERSGADIVVTDCETCKWQIEENTNLKAVHPVELLAMTLASSERLSV